MTETIQQLKEDIAILQEKLNKLEEAEKEPDMMLMRQGKVDIVDYDTKTYYRIEYTDSFSGAYVWFVRRRGEDYIRQVRDINVYGVLEDYYQKQVMKQIEEYPYKKYTPVEEAYKEVFGKYPETGSDSTEFDIQSWNIFRYGWNAAKEDGVVDEPDWYDEVEWDEKDNPASIRFKIADEVVNKLIRERQAQKLYNRLYDELDYDGMVVDDILEIVEDWLPKEQSAAGSQNVDTELLVDGFNHCLEKIKEMLR